MKTIKLLALLAAVLTFAACNKDKEELRHERDIVYTVDEDRHDAHLTTDAEFDTLLEEFCDFAQEGSTVTFYNALKTQNSKLKTNKKLLQGGNLPNHQPRGDKALDAADGRRGQDCDHHLRLPYRHLQRLSLQIRV